VVEHSEQDDGKRQHRDDLSEPSQPVIVQVHFENLPGFSLRRRCATT
jgi:hypothetical protein